MPNFLYEKLRGPNHQGSQIRADNRIGPRYNVPSLKEKDVLYPSSEEDCCQGGLSGTKAGKDFVNIEPREYWEGMDYPKKYSCRRWNQETLSVR